MKYSNSKSNNSKITLEHVLNNFFSFYFVSRDPKITELLLQSQYPVVGVDSFMPVVDVFSGSTRGNLRVCLAMGLAQQITALQRMRDDELTHVSPLPRPAHMLDHRPHVETKASSL